MTAIESIGLISTVILNNQVGMPIAKLFRSIGKRRALSEIEESIAPDV